jgi:hypothetical protein
MTDNITFYWYFDEPGLPETPYSLRDLYCNIFEVDWEPEEIINVMDVAGNLINRHRRRMILKITVPFFDSATGSAGGGLNPGLYKWANGEMFAAPYFTFVLKKDGLPYKIVKDKLGSDYYSENTDITLNDVFVMVDNPDTSQFNNSSFKKSIEFTFKSQARYFKS